jgi:hypothetical protein
LQTAWLIPPAVDCNFSVNFKMWRFIGIHK